MKHKHKTLLIALGLVALIGLAGCTDSGAQTGEDLAKNTSESISGVEIGKSAMFEMRLTEKNQVHLVKKRPPFTMEDSLERKNLIRRYKYLNDADNRHHVYLLSHDGKVIDHSVATGKVSSVNSKLTNDKQIVRAPGCEPYQGGEGACFKVLQSPQMDGSYGTNGAAIFWFDVDGHYHEWNGLYYVSEQPLDVTTQPTLIESTDKGVTVVQTTENSTADS